MAEFTRPAPGTICWRELTTQNSEKAQAFYQELLGWTLEKSKLSGAGGYTEIHLGHQAIGGMMQITKDWGENWEKIPTHWMTYIAVENCDATVEKIKENGGKICVPPFDVANVGRMSVVNDPTGATFSVIQFVG